MNNFRGHDDLSKDNAISETTCESKKRVAVIGYGILGLTAVEFLDRNNFEIHIFDLDSQETSPAFFPEPIGPKSLMHPMSSPIGSPGNLDQWGRAITNCIESKNDWTRDFIEKVPELSRQLVKCGFPYMHLQVHDASKTYLKIDHANMTKYKRSINSNIHQANVIRHYALVNDVAVNDDFVQVTFKSDVGSIKKLNFDIAIICAGPINSFNLITRSGLIPSVNSAEYLDHPTIWLGKIRTRKMFWVHSRLQNKKIVFGAKPGAIVISPQKEFSVTIRVRPVSGKGIAGEQATLLVRVMRYLKPKLAVSLGLFFSKNFSIAISFDFKDSIISGVLSKNGEVHELKYSNSGPTVDLQFLEFIDDVIRENFGEFEKTWENETSSFEESSAAHYAGFLGLMRDAENNPILDGFKLKKAPQISLPGSVSFPGPVIGHPTYLALLSVLYEVERVNAILLNE